MTKQELLDHIAALEGFTILGEKVISSTNPVHKYDIEVIIKRGQTFDHNVIPITVFRPNTPEEEALPAVHNQTKIFGLDTPVKDAAVAFLNTEQANVAALKRWDNLSVNETKLYGTVTVWLEVNGKIEQRNYFMWEDNGIQYKELA